jgi:putative ABC transport system permease protein
MEVRTQQASTDLTRIFTVDFHGVLAGYFETLRTPVLAGRTFAEDDIARGRNVAVIDQLLANEAFPNESAGGKRIFLPFGEPPWVDVIGVVAHQRTDSLADPGRREQIYFPDTFGGIGMSRYWAIRTAGNPAQYAAAISAAVAEVDKQFVISKVQPSVSVPPTHLLLWP